MTKFWHAFHDRIYTDDELGAWDNNFFYDRLATIEAVKRGMDTDEEVLVWPAETEAAIQHRLELFRPFTEEEEKEVKTGPVNLYAWAVENHARCCGCSWENNLDGGEPNGIFAGWTKEEVGGGWL